MPRILWKSWSKEYAVFELERIKKLDLSCAWANGNTVSAKSGDILFSTNGQYSKSNALTATVFYEPYIYLKKEYDNFSLDARWDYRFVYNQDLCGYKNVKLIPYAGYWQCDGKNVFRGVKKDTLFGMVLGNKKRSPVHETDIGYIRQRWVNQLARKDFKYWGPGWGQDTNYQGEIYFSNDKFVDSRVLLSKCKFGLAFDNSILKGYLTEKIWSCMLADTVPIYYGHRSIFNTIPADCFIYGYDYSINEIINMCESIDNSIYEKYLENIRIFIDNDKIHSWEFFFKHIDGLWS